jgi:hypothetical protein
VGRTAVNGVEGYAPAPYPLAADPVVVKVRDPFWADSSNTYAGMDAETLTTLKAVARTAAIVPMCEQVEPRETTREDSS